MTPTTSQVHYDQILGNVSILYKNGEFIGDQIAPVIPVTFRSDHYYVFSKADEFRDTAQYRAPGTSSNRDGFGLSTDSYECKEIAQSTRLESAANGQGVTTTTDKDNVAAVVIQEATDANDVVRVLLTPGCMYAG